MDRFVAWQTRTRPTNVDHRSPVRRNVAASVSLWLVVVIAIGSERDRTICCIIACCTECAIPGLC